MTDEMINCRACEGTGEIWTECCSGSNECPCRGMQVAIADCPYCLKSREMPASYEFHYHNGIPLKAYDLINRSISEHGYIIPDAIQNRR